MKAEFLSVGRNFNPEVGFTRRLDFERSFGEVRFSPRPKNIKSVRKFTWSGTGEYIVNGASVLDTRIFAGHFITEFESSDQFQIDVTNDFERLVRAFVPVGSTDTIPAGAYTFSDVAVAYGLGAQRRVSGTITLRAGDYYNGTIRSVTVGPGAFAPRISILTQLSLEPTFSLTRITFPTGAFTTRLARMRVDYGFSPLMFVSGLAQYSSADRTVSTNLRFRWEYRPGSDLFLVYTDERDATEDRLMSPMTVRGLRNRAFVVKINRLVRF